MKLLLDTHALLWWLNDDRHLGHQARHAIADPDNDVLISVVSLWEIAFKVRVGKLRTDVAAITKAIDRGGFPLLTISVPHLLTLSSLPFHQDHRDPFDHLLVAQAMTEKATLLSEDRRVPRYAVKVLSCSGS